MSKLEPTNPLVEATSATAANTSFTITSPLRQEALSLKIFRLQDWLAVLESNRVWELLEAEEDNFIVLGAVENEELELKHVFSSSTACWLRPGFEDTDKYEDEIERASGNDRAKLSKPKPFEGDHHCVWEFCSTCEKNTAM